MRCLTFLRHRELRAVRLRLIREFFGDSFPARSHRTAGLYEGIQVESRRSLRLTEDRCLEIGICPGQSVGRLSRYGGPGVRVRGSGAFDAIWLGATHTFRSSTAAAITAAYRRHSLLTSTLTRSIRSAEWSLPEQDSDVAGRRRALDFATLALLHPGRVALTVGTGEAMNERNTTRRWPPARERSARVSRRLSTSFASAGTPMIISPTAASTSSRFSICTSSLSLLSRCSVRRMVRGRPDLPAVLPMASAASG